MFAQLPGATTNYLPLISVSVAHEGLHIVIVCSELFPVLFC